MLNSIREVQIKTIMRYHSHLLELKNSKKKTTSKTPTPPNTSEDAGQQELSFIAGGNAK